MLQFSDEIERDLALQTPSSNYFNKSPIEGFDVNQTIYNAYVSMAREHDYVFRYEGRRYTHKEVISLIDLAANAFIRIGVKQGEKVGLLLSGSMEVPICWFALSRIGAVAKFIDTRLISNEPSIFSAHSN